MARMRTFRLLGQLRPVARVLLRAQRLRHARLCLSQGFSCSSLVPRARLRSSVCRSSGALRAGRRLGRPLRRRVRVPTRLCRSLLGL